MIRQPNNRQKKVAQADPLLQLAELLIKINKREKVVKVSTEGASNESDKRSSDKPN
jgi:hypothetical protein